MSEHVKIKVAYVAHPVSGDVKGNIDRIAEILRKINLEEPNTVPFAPYIGDLLALNDGDQAERARGIANNTHLLKSGIVDELRLYGDRISGGMREEVKIARNQGVPIIAMTSGTRAGHQFKALDQVTIGGKPAVCRMDEYLSADGKRVVLIGMIEYIEEIVADVGELDRAEF